MGLYVIRTAIGRESQAAATRENSTNFLGQEKLRGNFSLESAGALSVFGCAEYTGW